MHKPLKNEVEFWLTRDLQHVIAALSYIAPSSQTRTGTQPLGLMASCSGGQGVILSTDVGTNTNEGSMAGVHYPARTPCRIVQSTQA